MTAHSTRPTPVPGTPANINASTIEVDASYERDTTELAARAAFQLFTSTTRHRRPDRENAWLADAKGFSVPFGGGELPAWSWGTAGDPVVLLVHGWDGRGSQLGAFAAPLVSRGYRVVAFDMPGHGEATGTRAHLGDFVDALAAVAGAVGPLEAIVAHSFGAEAVNIATARGLVVGRLIFVAPLVSPGVVARRFAEFAGLSPQVAALFRDELENAVGISLEVADGWRLARTQRAPLLVVHDRDDAEMPAKGSKVLVEAWPTAELLLTAGLGHRRILRDAEVTESAARFIAGEPARPLTEAELIDRELFDREARRRRAFP